MRMKFLAAPDAAGNDRVSFDRDARNFPKYRIDLCAPQARTEAPKAVLVVPSVTSL